MCFNMAQYISLFHPWYNNTDQILSSPTVTERPQMMWANIRALSLSPQVYSPSVTGLQRVGTCCHKAGVPSLTVIYTQDLVRQTLSGFSGQTINQQALCSSTQRLGIQNTYITHFISKLSSWPPQAPESHPPALISLPNTHTEEAVWSEVWT